MSRTNQFAGDPRREERRLLVTLKGRKTWMSERRAQTLPLENMVALLTPPHRRMGVRV